ncbi:MAG: caspase family protein [Bryobacteraceae bacterium]
MLLALATVAAGAAAGQEGKRVALLIGNNAYPVSPLRNAVNDARAMDKALQGAGFRTIVCENGTKVAMEQSIVEFLQALRPEDTALFFYAGHAVQVENENMLIPVDFSTSRDVVEAKFKSISLAMLFDYLKRQRVARSIVIVDACRSNPVAERHSLEAGLAIPLNAGKETYIAFSTSPSHVAADNPEGQNSWFTEALADYVAQPGLTIDEVFNRVRLRVGKATQGRQTPWSQTSLTARFYFHPPVGLEAENDPSLFEKWLRDALRHEQRGNWPEAIALLQQVVKKQPGGALDKTARHKLPYLTLLNEAETHLEARDFAAAAELYEKALNLDAFSMQSAFPGADCYLLADRLPDAVRLLKAVRARGSSSAAAKADGMLKELAAVHPAAAAELKAGLPEPPPAQEVFADVRFGVPDWEAAARYPRAFPLDLRSELKDVALAAPAAPAPLSAGVPPPFPAPPAPAPAEQAPEQAASQPSPEAFHIELISVRRTRDLRIREMASGEANTSGVTRRGGRAVKVTTDPSGAELAVEGDPEQRCQSPCVLSLIPDAAVRVSMDGFRTELRRIGPEWVEKGVHIVLTQDFGFVYLAGPQENVTVLLDGIPIARQIPARLQVPAGAYQVRTVEQGKAVKERQVEVKPLGTVQLAVRE